MFIKHLSVTLPIFIFLNAVVVIILAENNPSPSPSAQKNYLQRWQWLLNFFRIEIKHNSFLQSLFILL